MANVCAPDYTAIYKWEQISTFVYGHGGTHVTNYDDYENGHITIIRYGKKLTFSERLIRTLFGHIKGWTSLSLLEPYGCIIALYRDCFTFVELFINSVSYSTQCCHSVYDFCPCKACVCVRARVNEWLHNNDSIFLKIWITIFRWKCLTLNFRKICGSLWNAWKCTFVDLCKILFIVE